MDSTTVYYCILAILPLLYIIKSCIPSIGPSHHGLRLPPEPWKLPLIGSLHHLIGGFFAPAHRVLRDLSCRYGPLVFLKLGEVPVIVVSSREAAEEVMKTHDAILASRPQTATIKMIRKYGNAISFSPYGNEWRQLRKILMLELLSAKHVQSFRAIREEEVTRLVQAVSSASTPLVNLSELLVAYTTDVTVRSIMGDRLKDRNTLLSKVTEAVKLASTFRLADLFPSLHLACVLSRKFGKIELYMDRLLEFMDNIISENHEKKIQRDEAHQEDMMDVLLRIHKEGNPQFALTMGTIKAFLFDLLTAGTETVSSVLDWTMAELMRNPLVMSRAQSEVRRAFMGQMKVTEEGLSKLSYLHWVIKETLRLHAPTPMLIPRENQEKTCSVMGYDFPKGTMVLVNAWAISRDHKYWDEPETFKPERFETDTRDFKGHDFEFTPFGAGRRMCPGFSLGLASVELVLANLLLYFDWNLPDGVHANELDMTETMGLLVRRKAELWVKPILRVPFASQNY